MSELKPCPFCGSDADFEEVNKYETTWSAGCSDVTCFGYQSTNTFATKKAAAQAWNTRATPPPSGDLVDYCSMFVSLCKGLEMDPAIVGSSTTAGLEAIGRAIASQAKQAPQGVTISRECAENSLNVVRSVLEDSEEQIRKLGLFKQRSARTKYRSVLKVIEATENELAKALEHSNGR